MKKILILILFVNVCSTKTTSYDKSQMTKDVLGGCLSMSGAIAPLGAYEDFTHWISKDGPSIPSFNTLKGLCLVNLAATSAAASFDAFESFYYDKDIKNLRPLLRPAICATISFITSKIANDRYSVSFTKSLPLALWMASVFYYTYDALKPIPFTPL